MARVRAARPDAALVLAGDGPERAIARSRFSRRHALRSPCRTRRWPQLFARAGALRVAGDRRAVRLHLPGGAGGGSSGRRRARRAAWWTWYATTRPGCWSTRATRPPSPTPCSRFSTTRSPRHHVRPRRGLRRGQRSHRRRCAPRGAAEPQRRAAGPRRDTRRHLGAAPARDRPHGARGGHCPRAGRARRRSHSDAGRPSRRPRCPGGPHVVPARPGAGDGCDLHHPRHRRRPPLRRRGRGARGGFRRGGRAGAPDILLMETFPLGRRAFRAELLPVLQRARRAAAAGGGLRARRPGAQISRQGQGDGAACARARRPRPGARRPALRHTGRQLSCRRHHRGPDPLHRLRPQRTGAARRGARGR